MWFLHVTVLSQRIKYRLIKLQQLQEGMTIYHKSLDIIYIHKIYPRGFDEIVVDGGKLSIEKMVQSYE